MHPKLLESTISQCRAYIEAADCHGEAPPIDRLVDAVAQLATVEGVLALPEEVIEAAYKAFEERRRQRYIEREKSIEERISQAHAGAGDFKPLELHYAATMRCMCGHGMAYPEGIGGRGAWYCSAILKGVADRTAVHTPAHSFMGWSIKSEDQCYRVSGRSTRPADEPLRDFTVQEQKRWGGTVPERVMPSIELGDPFRKDQGMPPRVGAVE